MIGYNPNIWKYSNYENDNLQTYGQVRHQKAPFGHWTAPSSEGMRTEAPSNAQTGKDVLSGAQRGLYTSQVQVQWRRKDCHEGR